MKPTFRSGQHPARGTLDEAHTSTPQSPAAASSLKRPGSPTPLANSERPSRLQRTGLDAAYQPRPIRPETEAKAPQRPIMRGVSPPHEAGAGPWQYPTLADAAGQGSASASLSRSLTPLPLDQIENLDPHRLSPDEADHLAALLHEAQPLAGQMLEPPTSPSVLPREIDIFPHALDEEIVELFRNARNLDIPPMIWTRSAERPQSPGSVSDFSETSIGSPQPLSSRAAPGLRGLSHQDVDELIALFGQTQASASPPIAEHGGLANQGLAHRESPLPAQEEPDADIQAFDADEIVALLSGADDVDRPAGLETKHGSEPPDSPGAQAQRDALVQLGYSSKQIESLQPQSRAAVIHHHQALTAHGFGHGEIHTISKRFASLQFLARDYSAVQQLLPDLDRAAVVKIVKVKAGEFALAELLRVAADLKALPLQLTDHQLGRIARLGKRPALETLHRLRHELTVAPLSLSIQQVVSMASNGGCKQAMMAIRMLMPALCTGDHALTTAQVVAIASNTGGKQALETTQRLLPILSVGEHALTTEQVVTIASHDGGKHALETIQKLLPELCTGPHALTTAQVVAIASNNGGKHALMTILKLLPKLCTGEHALTIAQVVAIASNNGGKQALEASHNLLPELCSGTHTLTTEQVVAIASNGGGKQALEAVQRLRPDLCTGEHALTTEQVVAIASNGGGKQALEAVLRLRPDLCTGDEPWTVAEVVAVASRISGRLALEAAHGQHSANDLPA